MRNRVTLRGKLSALAFVTIAAAGILFAGCNKQSSTSPSTTLNSDKMQSSAPQSTSEMTSPTAQNTDEVINSEGDQLTKLNQDAGNVDKSINDKPIDVNQ
jgi:hypothetical protein